ncbi:DUF2975 domain-containing protein [Altererythrobacter xixiisoli]|uniref:DUF2975 domain-containing protein n=1 Tax=Croceibacterium xixiisoli TaxID=1476466 RepID=A0A6I4U002_9SPHN|nr:DUF2975 domain-containing protein [Croceibacterium xixiisoli]MXP00209.1 DUF2975 domain-containing protein [Croceibacterium xixiisoli]
MPIAPKDPLLTAARITIIIARIALVIGMIGLGVAAAVTLIGSSRLSDQITIAIEQGGVGEVTGGATLVILLTLFSLGLMYDFAARLAQIIDTVGQGDPFTLANAARLTRMGWLAVGVQLLALPSMLLSTWLETRVDKGVFHLDSDLSLTGIALALVLFILARVFRTGAAMRDDLEGTV